ncbi:zinc-ribbon domain-containing protein [Inediibacterium massiliense]|uniref:zinc-ribbon domain-containing protein n=1 Tax=Inediibacterium massiliense TaxID=1658111 RepID=UPI0006B55DCC|nr:zinc-ribbon domain-containing protein [Inediibacterium massiliense]
MNLLNKVKQGMIDGKKAIQEISSDMTELTRMKIALSKDISRIDELYYNLGRKLYDFYQENPDISLSDEVEFSIMELHATLARINDYEEKIKLLKGITRCDACGNEIEENPNFCPHCGHKIQKESEELKDEDDIEKN